MTATTKPTGRVHPSVYDIPLPGNYPCLTLQLNLTRYQFAGVGKFVLVVREPSDGVEVHRRHIEICDWGVVLDEVERRLPEGIEMMRYLQTAKNRD